MLAGLAAMHTPYDFCPWLFWSQAGPGEQQTQMAHQAAAAATGRARFGQRCYLSPVAGFVPEDVSLGDHSYVAAYAYVTGNVVTGAHCTVNPFAVVRGNVRLGEGVRIGAHSSLLGFNHRHEDLSRPVYQQGVETQGITVGDDVWIGSGCLILDGVTVGSHCLIGAGAVVTKDVPDWSVVAGNPACVVRDRRAPKKVRPVSLEMVVADFGRRVGTQWSDILRRSEAVVEGVPRYLDSPAAPQRNFRPNCDAIEIAANFGERPALLPREEWIELLQATQDAETGVPTDPWEPNPPEGAPLAVLGSGNTAYQILSVGYALECLGAHFRQPIHAVDQMSVDILHALLAGLPWREAAWGAGAWVDALGTALWMNGHRFGLAGPVAPLFDWLRAHCQPHTGLWGDSRPGDGWLQPVNGFYRLTRGTYAQFGLPLPQPESAIDTVLAHTRLNGSFESRNVNACNVLDVVHPLWLCGQQSEHRRPDIRREAERQLRLIPGYWRDGAGFGFAPTDEPGLQGTEMWLATYYIAADILGLTKELAYSPKGVHRLRAPE